MLVDSQICWNTFFPMVVFNKVVLKLDLKEINVKLNHVTMYQEDGWCVGPLYH